MPQLSLEIPDSLAVQLARLAAEQKKSVEQVALEQLASALARSAESLQEQYERFFKESGLFIEPLAEHERPGPPVSEERLKELAAKLGAAGPLSEVILEERGSLPSLVFVTADDGLIAAAQAEALTADNPNSHP